MQTVWSVHDFAYTMQQMTAFISGPDAIFMYERKQSSRPKYRALWSFEDLMKETLYIGGEDSKGYLQ